MADQPTHVQLPDGTYVEIPPDATPEQLSAFRTKLAQKFPQATAPDLKTGAGMEQYAQQQARHVPANGPSVTTDIQTGHKSVDPSLQGETLMERAAREQGEQQNRLGYAMNRAQQSPTPVTNASALYAPVGAARAIIGSKLASSGAGLVADKLNASPETKEKVQFGAGLAGGLAGGLFNPSYLSDEFAPRLGNSALGAKAKVIQSEANFGREPGRFIAKSPGMAGSTAETLPTNIQARLNDIGSQISARVNSPQVASRVQNIEPQLDSVFSEALKDPIARGDTATVNAINDLKSRLTQIHTPSANGALVPTTPRNLSAATPAELWQEKQYLGDNTKWSGTAFDKGQPLNDLRIKLYGIYKNAMENADPGIKTLSDQYASGLTAAEAARAQAARVRTAPPGVGGIKKAAALGMTSTPVKTAVASLFGGKYPEPGPLPAATQPRTLFQGPGSAPPNAAGIVTATGSVQNPGIVSIDRSPTGLRGIKTTPAGLLPAPKGPTRLLPERSGAPLITPPPGYSQGVTPEIVEQGYGVRRVANNGSGESSASLESINRTASEKVRGVKYFLEDRGGNRVPLSSTDTNSGMKLGPGKRIIRVDKNGESVYR